ncbi:MAG: ABC transporter ATP-binding protein [bacterium]|nr:ABC transporter ATP-binding protein [bacterium]
MWRYAYPDDEDGKKARISWALVGRVLSYGRPYRRLIGVLLVLILIQSGIGLLTPLILRDLLDVTLPNGDVARLNLLALGLIAIPVIEAGIGVVVRRFNATVGEGVIYDLRRTLYGHLQKMSLRFFTNTRSGELMSRLNNDVVNAQSAISDTIIGTVTQTVQLIATLVVMLTLEWRLTLLGVAVFPFVIVAARAIGKRLRKIAREQMEINAQMNAMLSETMNVSGILLVKLFGRTRLETDRFADRAAQVRDTGIRRAVLGSFFWTLLGAVSIVGTVLVYWVGGHFVLSGVFTAGTIVAFAAYLGQLYGPMQYLVDMPIQFATSMVSFERVFEIVDLPLEIDEKPNAIALDQVRGALTFDQVTFRYPAMGEGGLSHVNRPGRMDNVVAVFSGTGAAGKPPANGDTPAASTLHQARDMALEALDFHIEPGQLVALVGPSGAGKTTLTYLIPRLYDPVQGRILIDGIDLRDVTLESLMAQIGMVTQETYLFHDTIRTNLVYARLDATQAQIEAACRAANIHEFIMGLPDGYDTIVGERGYRLSGGEKQRLALARVILKDPRILVLDEATSHLDSQSEALIQDALQTIMANRTSIVIAHRLSTILAADQILVLDRGRIVERGTHASLIAQSGLYASLYETQFRQQQPEPITRTDPA